MKFSIRDLLLVTVIVALAVGWWTDRQGLVRWGMKKETDRERAEWDAEALKREIEEMGAEFELDLDGLHTDYQYPNGARRQSSQHFHSKIAK